MIDISFVIVSFNATDYLRKCLKSIYKYCDHSFEIIITDNCSTENNVEMIRTEFPLVDLIVNQTNPGFSAANNQGIKKAAGKYIFLLNPDTELTSGLAGLIGTEDSNTIKAPQLINADGSLQVSAWPFPGLWNIIAETFFLHKIFNSGIYPPSKTKSLNRVDAASGAALFFNSELITVLQGLDEDLFWMEDIDFCYRASLIGIPTIYIPDVKIIHHGGKSSLSNMHIAISNQLFSKARYLKKHSSQFIWALSLLFIFIHIVTRLVAFTILSVVASRFRIKRFAYYYALQKFFSSLKRK